MKHKIFHPVDIWAGACQNQQNDVRPAKTLTTLGIHPAWSESSLCTQWVAKALRLLHTDTEDTDQTVSTPRLIWSESFAGRTSHLVCFVVCWLILCLSKVRWATSWRNLLMPNGNKNKNADQLAYPHGLISIFVVRSLDRIKPEVAIQKLSRP